MNDGPANALFYALLLILPLSALVARRIPLKSTAKMAVTWVGIFTIGLLLVSGKDRFKSVWSSASGLLYPVDQTVTGQTVQIKMADHGHFWATVDVNGVHRRMLIDSGATTTALTSATAKAAGLDLEESPFPTTLDTANGTVFARVSTIKALKIGSIEAKDLGAVVSPAFGDTDVIGMNFLSKLKSWRVEGQTLILEPATPDGP